MTKGKSSPGQLILLVSDWVNWVVIRVLGVMVAALLVITLYEVFFRYVLRNPLPWPVPVSRILLIWIALLGISVALKAGEHVAVEGAVLILPPRYQKLIMFLDYLIIGIWLAVIIWQGWLATTHATQLMVITRALRIQFKWRLAAVPLSGILQFIHLLAGPAILHKAVEGEEKEGQR